MRHRDRQTSGRLVENYWYSGRLRVRSILMRPTIARSLSVCMEAASNSPRK